MRFIIGIGIALSLCASPAQAQVLERCTPITRVGGKSSLPKCPPERPQPVLEPACARKLQLHAVDNATGVLFDARCTTAFVLPPVFGRVRAPQLDPHPNLQLCPALRELQAHVLEVLDRVAELVSHIELQLAEIDRVQVELSAAQRELDLAAQARNLGSAERDLAASNLAALSSAAQDAQNEYDNCELIFSAAECQAEAQALASARAELTNYRATVFDPASARAHSVQAVFDQAFARFSAALAASRSALEPVIALVSELSAAQEAIEAEYLPYAGLEGARGKLTYNTRWDELVNAYRNANPDAKLSYKQLPLTAAQFFAATVVQGDLTTIPALLSAQLPDAAAGGLELLSRGTELTIEIVLSLAGACQFFPDPSALAPRLDLNAEQLAAYVALQLGYSYNVLLSDTLVRITKASAIAQQLDSVTTAPEAEWSAKLAMQVQTHMLAESFLADMQSMSVEPIAQPQTSGLPGKPRITPELLYRTTLQSGSLTFVP